MTNIFDPNNRLARDIAGDNWMKFNTVGDKVGGIVRDIFEKPEKDQFPAQRCFTLEQEDGSMVNVGLKRTDYILTRTDLIQMGDELGVEFSKEIPPKVKGFNPAKSLVIYTKLNGPRTGIAARDIKPVENSEDVDDYEINPEDVDSA